MITFFIPIVEALVAGYVTAVAVYMVLLFLITRFGRKVLTSHNSASTAYSAMHALAWGVTAAAAAWVCSTMSPLQPYGGVGFPVMLAIGLCLTCRRSYKQLPGQMSAAAFALILVLIFAGTGLALYAHGAFAARIY